MTGSNILVGGLFNAGLDPRGVPARVGVKNFRQVEEVNEQAPHRTRAMLHMQNKDEVFLWTANRASNDDHSNTIGWRLVETTYPNPPGGVFDHLFPNPKEWSFSYQESGQVGFINLQDGFGPLGIGWREPNGHFRGRWGGGHGAWDEAYYLGVSSGSERDKDVRRGFRRSGDRFEPPPRPARGTPLRGRFMGRIVTQDGFRGSEDWIPCTQFYAFFFNTGFAPFTIEVNRFVFICTRSGVSNNRESPPDFNPAIRARIAPGTPRLSPVFERSLILSSWVSGAILQPGVLMRPNRRNTDGRYYLFVCTKVEGRGHTSPIEPAWPNATGAEVTEETWDNVVMKKMVSRVTWKCLGPDPDSDCIVEETSGLQWTCVGPVADFAEYGPVYERGEEITTGVEERLLDEYPVPAQSCAQFDVVVTCLGTTAPVQAASFTLRAACYHNGSEALMLGDAAVERRSTRDDLVAELRLHRQDDGLWSMRLYVCGAAGLPLQWRSLRRPHNMLQLE